MAYFEWDSSLSIGIEIIDEQHKCIIDYMNELASILEFKREVSKVYGFENNLSNQDVSKLQSILNELVNYTIIHFAFEENMLEKANYPYLESHKNVHSKFVNMIEGYQKKLDAVEDITESLLIELKEWLINHIKKDDKDYSSDLFKILDKKSLFDTTLKTFFG